MASLQIFVSHSHEDTAFSDVLVKALRMAGADVWYDEHNLEPGQSMEMIEQELDHRKVFIPILSKDAFGSKWVQQETALAYGHYRRDPTRVILPVTAGRYSDTDFSAGQKLSSIRGFSRIEAQDHQPLPIAAAIVHTLRVLGLTLFAVASAIEQSYPTASGSVPAIMDKVTPHIFISYRHEDSAAGHAGRLCDDLARRYGGDKVFIDTGMDPGVDFVDFLKEAVATCSVLLVVIGRIWLTVTDTTGRRRLDNPEDWVHIEVAAALGHTPPIVIPVLFHGAQMPNADDLPDDLKPLARHQAHEITDKRWNYDVASLVTVLDKFVGFTS